MAPKPGPFFTWGRIKLQTLGLPCRHPSRQSAVHHQGTTEAALPPRMYFAGEPTNSIGFHWIIRWNGNLFGVIAFGAVERAKFKSCRPRRGAHKLHAGAAFWAAELLNCKQWDCGWVICHCIPPCLRRERTLSVTGRSRRRAVMGSVDSAYVLGST